MTETQLLIASIKLPGLSDETLTEIITKAMDKQAMAFAEWIADNQFKMFGPSLKERNIWTSTKVHYSPDKYTTSELLQLFKNQQTK